MGSNPTASAMSIPDQSVRDSSVPAASPNTHQVDAAAPTVVSTGDEGSASQSISEPHVGQRSTPGLVGSELSDLRTNQIAEAVGTMQVDGETGDGPDEASMRLALGEANAALAHDDVPVGAIVVHRGAVIASRHNERELTNDPTAHAEVLAMRDAATSVGSWRLDECTMYVTLEPCAMCAGAMVNARLGRLVFGATDPKAGAAGSRFDLVDSALLNHRVPRTTGVLAEACGRILVDFFAAKRRK